MLAGGQACTVSSARIQPTRDAWSGERKQTGAALSPVRPTWCEWGGGGCVGAGLGGARDAEAVSRQQHAGAPTLSVG